MQLFYNIWLLNIAINIVSLTSYHDIIVSWDFYIVTSLIDIWCIFWEDGPEICMTHLALGRTVYVYRITYMYMFPVEIHHACLFDRQYLIISISDLKLTALSNYTARVICNLLRCNSKPLSQPSWAQPSPWYYCSLLCAVATTFRWVIVHITRVIRQSAAALHSKIRRRGSALA